MKKQNTQSKVIVALTAVVLLLVALSATLTFAYFTATNNASSTQMQFGTLSLTSPTATAAKADTCTEATTKLVPGCSITVSGGATVEGNIDALMRLRVTAEVYKTKKLNNDNELVNIEQGDEGAAQYALVDNKVVPFGSTGTPFWAVKDETAGENFLTSIKAAAPTGWQVSGNYFYSTKLVSGTVAPAEFTSTFATSAANLGNDWQGAYVQFKVVAEAIQADHLVNGANKVVIAKDGSNVITSVTVGEGDSAITTPADMFTAIAAVDAWTVDLTTGVPEP